MTREKEIKRRLFEISTSNFNNSVVDSSAYFAGYVDGAQWADRTMIDKACEWLEDNLYELIRDQEFIGTMCRYMDKKVNIEQFRKAMKGGEE